MSEIRKPIPARLYNATQGGHVAGAEDIFDDSKNKNQAVINSENDANFAQVDNEIEALEKQDVIPVDTLPSVSEANPKAIYRVAAEDSYTDYMVNASGDGWKELAEFSFPGIDEEPTAESDNLVKSGGIYDFVQENTVKDNIEADSDNAARSGAVFELSVKNVTYGDPLTGSIFSGYYSNGEYRTSSSLSTYYFTLPEKEEGEENRVFNVHVQTYSFEDNTMTVRWTKTAIDPTNPPATIDFVGVESSRSTGEDMDIVTKEPDGAVGILVLWRAEMLPIPVVKKMVSSTLIPTKDYVDTNIGVVSDDLPKKYTEGSTIEGTPFAGYYRDNGMYQDNTSYQSYDFPVIPGKTYKVYVPPINNGTDVTYCRWTIGYRDKNTKTESGVIISRRRIIALPQTRVKSNSAYVSSYTGYLTAPEDAICLTILFRPNMWVIPVVTELTENILINVEDYVSGMVEPINKILPLNVQDENYVSAIAGHDGQYGYYRVDTGAYIYNASYIHYDYPVTPGKTYHVNIPQFTQSSVFTACRWVVAVIGEINTEDPSQTTGHKQYNIGIPESRIPIGGKTVDLDLVAPQDAIALLVISRPAPLATGVPTLRETIQTFIPIEEFVDSKVNDTTKLMKVKVVDGNNFFIRTSFDNTQDLMMHIGRKSGDSNTNSNENITPIESWLGEKELTDDGLMDAENLFHTWGDSTGPIFNTSRPTWHLFTQHGFRVPNLRVANNGLTSDDIGSTWAWNDGSNNHYFDILAFGPSNVILLPHFAEDAQVNGLYTCDWKYNTWDEQSMWPITLTRTSSGGSDVNQLVANSYYITNFQLKPIQEPIDRYIELDGKPLTEDGIYYGNDLTISETLIWANPWTIETWYDESGKMAPVRNTEMGRYTQLFHVHGMSIRYDTTLNAEYPIMFDKFGVNQAQHTEQKEGYEIYVFVPRSKYMVDGHATDVPFLNRPERQGDTGYNQRSINCDRNDDDCYDINKMPERLVSYLQNEEDADDKLIGFASGLSLTRGITRDSERVNYIPSNARCMSVSADQNNKMYVTAIHSDEESKFGVNKLIPDTFCKSFSTYFCYYDPNANEGQVYWYKEGNGYVVYAHSQAAADKRVLNLEAGMDGLHAEVVDSKGMTLLTDLVMNGKVYVQADNIQNGYIVLKLS